MSWLLRHVAIAALTVLTMPCVVGVDRLGAEPLSEALHQLVLTNPQVAEMRKEVAAARAGIGRAYAQYLPHVAVRGEYGPQYIDSPVTREAGGGAFSETKEVVGLRVTQRLFDGFETPSEVRAARLNLEVAEYTLNGTRQNMVFEGIAAYVQVLRESRLVELSRDNEATIARQLNLEDERVKRGAGIAVDVLQAKSRLQIAKEQRVAFEGSLLDAATRYTRLFGEPPNVPTMYLPDLPWEEIPADLERVLQIAEQENPAIDASLAAAEIASERRRQARADYFPQFDLVAAANREKNNDLVRGTRNDLSVFLAMTWSLFEGFATQASVRQAAFWYRAAQDNYEQVRREVLEHTRLAWNELLTTRERVTLLENAVAIASEVFEAREKLRSAGRETAINVLDAENELNRARIALSEAKGDRHIAAYRVMQGMGRLEPRFVGVEFE
jgi:adhesin transport system outer membrane protein